MDAWDMQVVREDLRRTRIVPAEATARDLAEGEALLEVESFALTANNVTYAAAGYGLGYWRFFPSPGEWGRVPAWGFARVMKSRAPDAPEGMRLFGYWPMSNRHVAKLRAGPGGIVDASPHRAQLPPTYNSYTIAPPDALDDYRSLLRPLFGTGWLIDDQLSEEPEITTLVLSSASSKTALSLAWNARKRGLRIVGLTSPGTVELLKGVGLYDQVLAYDEAEALGAAGPAAYVDFAARAETTDAVHRRLGDGLRRSVIVGVTNWERAGQPAAPPSVGPQPALFFAPDHMQKRAKELGPEAFQQRYDDALRGFVADNGWLQLKHHRGPDALQALWAELLEGRVRADEGLILIP